MANNAAVPPSVVVLWPIRVYITIQRVLLTKSIITYTSSPDASAAWTVVSYSEKKVLSMVPPRVGVINCQAVGWKV